MLSIDMRFMLYEEKLPFLTNGLTPWQIWWSLSVCKTGSWMLGLVWCTHPIVLWMKSIV